MPPLVMTEAENVAAQRLIEIAFGEDLGNVGDVTTNSLIDESAWATVNVVAREPGVVAGGALLPLVFSRLDPRVRQKNCIADGESVVRGTRVAQLEGPLRALLTGERTALNFLLHLSGVATQTRRFVELAAGTRAGIYDTRKTLPGWRLLEKYAVRAGGGRNHRIGLYDQVLIKDNHLAGWFASGVEHSIAAAISRVRSIDPRLKIEVEVDTLEQLFQALEGRPDMVLLDNMEPEQLRQGVRIRDQIAPKVELEASGGVTLATVAAIARTGVERISVGGITHSAPALDLAFDWESDGHRPADPKSLSSIGNSQRLNG